MMNERTDAPDMPIVPAAGTPPRRPLFTLVSILALFLVPAAIVATIALTVLLSPGFYTGILKEGRLIAAFVEGRNLEIERRVNDEIESELRMSHHTAELEGARSRHERARAAWTGLRKEEEFESLERERKEIRGLSWRDVRSTFPTKDAFTRFRDQELQRIDGRLAEIRDHRAAHQEGIEAAESDLRAAQKEYETALSVMEKKEREAKKIAERHKDEGADSIYADLERIEKPLTKVVNERLLDGAVRDAITEVIAFFTDYGRQVEQRKVYYVRSDRGGPLGLPSLRVRLPSVSISLWVDDGAVPGRKRHVLSSLLVEELKGIDGLQNRFLLTTLFRLSDTRLGEYVGRKRLAGLGLSIREGILHMPGPVLEGDAAETAAMVMRVMSAARYAPYGAAGVLLLFVLYLFFSTAERRRKLVSLKRLFIYPSVLVILACGALLWASLSIFTFFPGFLEDLAARSYIRHLGFTAAWHFAAPLLAVFRSLLVAGLLIRKRLAREPMVRAGGSQDKE